MFPFGNKSLTESMDLVNYVSNDEYYKAKNHVEKRGYTKTELNSVYDVHGNNLLHLATMVGNAQMVGFFLEKGVSFTKQNKFKQSAWDMAILLRKNEIIEKFAEYKCTSGNSIYKNYDIENASLKSSLHNSEKTVQILTCENSNLRTKNSELVTKYSLRSREVTTLSGENSELRLSNKRLRSENDSLLLENTELKDKNKKLKMSVDTLMENNKK